ncbi:chromate transporter [Paenibacillus physcomitrellae]|uniref:Chromate transporter n=1 Tax=Paenibacillus physcomitrellae TaxID=1619311 RepID=A0ABQ1FRI0_9BACL|nr:chromate transporter [Paenibacillus physcomitrellae]GGA27961.1 chromate transporter [Paenibacillus physcomitrellae]
MLFWQLFISFLKIGFMSFGGGYAVISMIQYETHRYGWLSDEEFQRTVALSGMSPGSIATNSATLIGYHIAGLPGAIVATAGIILPSLLIVILIAAFFFKLNSNPWVKSSFYGLRPVITGLILYAAIHFGFPDPSRNIINWTTLATLLIGAASFLAVIKYKVHPLKIILVSACAGIVLF